MSERADNLKVAICECLLAINAEVDPVTRQKWGPIVPPTAIDWIGDRLVSAILSTESNGALRRAADWMDANQYAEIDPATLRRIADELEAGE